MNAQQMVVPGAEAGAGAEPATASGAGFGEQTILFARSRRATQGGSEASGPSSILDCMETDARATRAPAPGVRFTSRHEPPRPVVRSNRHIRAIETIVFAALVVVYVLQTYGPALWP